MAFHSSKKVQELLASANPRVHSYVESGAFENAVSRIASETELTLEGKQGLLREAFLVLTGYADSDDFLQSLESEKIVAPEKMEQVAKLVSEQVFAPLSKEFASTALTPQPAKPVAPKPPAPTSYATDPYREPI